MHYIEMVQLLNFSYSYIRQILAGMKRCAAIGHALAMNPKVLSWPRQNNLVSNAQNQ